MSAPVVGLLWALFSAACIVVLAATDAKRRAIAAGRKTLRIAAVLVMLLPGVWLAFTVQSVAFLIWIGATAMFGWGIAAIANLIDPQHNPTARKRVSAKV